MKVRIGIDVGGTFTDAVVINNETYELIGTLKIPTTHSAEEGVASGIIKVIQTVMEKYCIAPQDVVFIAHGTTQATNALLEGDVVPVGIIGMGHGMESLKAKTDTQVGDIELAPSRFLRTYHRYIDTGKENNIEEIINELKNEGAQVLIASAAFSVDDPSKEINVVNKASEMGLTGTGSHEISKLYGLKIRTRTAAINASILPKMMETADMTESSIKRAGIKSPLMIMRCDGGVMDVNEVRKRPILTMLSGPAAGVAGALMYEKVSNGIFLEVGGTSTDISAIKNGKVMIEYAEVGGHKTYLNSLDVRTVGIAGGSMIQVGDSGVIDAGPRSAHIAGLGYAVYANPEDIIDPKIVLFQPKEGDPSNYAAVECINGKQYAITVSCAANILGYVKENDYAYGSKEAARKAFNPFAKKFNISVEEFAKQIMDKASEKNKIIVNQLISDYNLDPKHTVLVGGGGGSASIVPYLAEYLGMNHKLAKNSEVISPIGVALAMVRDTVERTISNPTDMDILKIRKEVEQAAIRSGASPQSIEIHVEIDTQRNIVRAIATGTTELRTKNLSDCKLDARQIIKIAAKSMYIEEIDTHIVGSTGEMYLIKGKVIQRKLLGLMKKVTYAVRAIDIEGVIRIQRSQGEIHKVSINNFQEDMDRCIENSTIYSDGGKEIPDVYLFYGKKIIDLSGLIEKNQIISLAKVEIQGLDENTSMYTLISNKNAV
jgi:N-methylhydantoinase A